MSATITESPSPKARFVAGPLVAPRVPDAFDARPYERFTVTPMSPTIGAEIGGVRLRGDLDDELMSEIRRALLEWKVLVFRDQDIERDDQRAFAARWGHLEQHPFFTYVQPGQTDDDVVTLAKDDKTKGVENNWHNDITWHVTPSFGAVLRAIEVPDVGGDTLWADMGAAYDCLDDTTKAQIDELVAVHDWTNSFGLGMPDDAVERLRPVFPPVEHPVVRVHPETGRRMLFVNAIFTQHIVGLDPDESSALLQTLYRHIGRPEFHCRLQWRPQTLAFWDNRAAQHYAVSDYYPARRVMDRISIVGDRPYGPSVAA